MSMLAIDPGPTRSGFVLLNEDNRVATSGVMLNGAVLAMLEHWPDPFTNLAIEMIASYGMPVGREVFETCVWIGRFQQAWEGEQPVSLVYRQTVKLHLCGNVRAKDQNVRQALLDLYPATGGGKVPQVGTKRQPGPLYGVSTHAWAALGAAVTAKATRARAFCGAAE